MDTQNPFGNWIARTFFHLSYRYAETEFKTNSDEQYTCKFTLPNTGTPEQLFRWQHTRDTFMPSKNPESLEFFLTERYRLFSYNKKRDSLLTGTLSHEPYQLNRPSLIHYSTDLFLSNAIEFTNSYPKSILACRKTKVDVFPIENVS